MSISLTEIQVEVLALLCAGRNHKEIAHERGTSLATIKSHVGTIKKKVGARTLCQLGAWGVRNGFAGEIP